MQKYYKYSPAVLRIGMAMVVLWFGFSQLSNVEEWVAYVPDSVVSMLNINATVLVYFNAAFEVVFGLMMLFGIKTRIASLLVALHLFDIMYVVGYGQIGVRDFGLAVATLSVFMTGPDILCFDYKKLDN